MVQIVEYAKNWILNAGKPTLVNKFISWQSPTFLSEFLSVCYLMLEGNVTKQVDIKLITYLQSFCVTELEMLSLLRFVLYYTNTIS